MITLRRVLTVTLVLILCLPVSSSGSNQTKRFVVAVIPNLPAVTLHRNWTPFIEELSRLSGVPLELKVYDTLDHFMEDCESGGPDFIYTAPNMFYLARRKQGYIPLVRSSRMQSGLVFVKKDSPYRSVRDLAGKTIAFVGPKNVCSVITRHAMMSGEGSIDYNATFSGSTINVAKSVLLGKADAGATLDISLTNDLPDLQSEFRVLLETPKIASHPFAAHPRVPRKVRERISEAVRAMAQGERGRALLSAVKLIDPVAADYDRDYRIFETVDFDRLERQTRK